MTFATVTVSSFFMGFIRIPLEIYSTKDEDVERLKITLHKAREIISSLKK